MAVAMFSTRASRCRRNADGFYWESRRAWTYDVALSYARRDAGRHGIREACIVPAGGGLYRVRRYLDELGGVYRRVVARTARTLAEDIDNLSFSRVVAGVCICTNKRTGGHYSVTRSSCTCPEYKQRASHVGAACKHLRAAIDRRVFDQSSSPAPSSPSGRADCRICGGSGVDRNWEEDRPCICLRRAQ